MAPSWASLDPFGPAARAKFWQASTVVLNFVRGRPALSLTVLGR